MGNDFAFIHCADLHLGSRFWGLSREDSDTDGRKHDAISESFEKIVDVGIQQSDFMVVSGDIYDDRYETPRTRLFFSQQCLRYGKPVFIVRGNHDYLERWEESIPYPDNVTVIGTEPENHRIEVGGHTVEIVGRSFPKLHTSENPTVGIRGSDDLFTVGVLHCSLTDIAQNTDYAPCSVADMTGKGVDYWALGHIHKRSVVRESGPAIVYPGNIQGRNPKETGRKGCYLVSVRDGRPSLEFVGTQTIIWEEAEVDITGLDTMEGLLDVIRESVEPNSFVRLSLKGRGRLNHLIRTDPEGFVAEAESVSGCDISLSSLSTMPDVDLDSLREGETLASEVVRVADRWAAMSDMEIFEELTKESPASDVRDRLRWYAEEGILREIVVSAEMSLLDRLQEGSQ